MNDDDKWSEFKQVAREEIARALAEHEWAPSDVVKGPGPTREQLLAMNDRVGQLVDYTPSPKPYIGSDGQTHFTKPPTGEKTFIGGAVVALAELEEVGLTPADVPKLSVWDFRNGGRKVGHDE